MKIDSITSLRFVAALLIALHHSRGSFGVGQNDFAGWNFGVAVSFFFVLSGFVLQYNYYWLKSFDDVKTFYLKRFFRIWPLHFICLIIVLLLMPSLIGRENFVLVLIANSLLVQGWIPIPDFYFSINPVSWSISTELFFYLAFPLLIVRSYRKSIFLLAITFGVVLLFIWFSRGFPSYSLEVANSVTSHGIVYISPITRLFEFFLGMVTCYVFRNTLSWRILSSPFLSTLCGVVALGVAAYWISPLGRYVDGKILSYNNAFGQYWGYTGVGLFWAFVIYFVSAPASFLRALMSNKTMVFLGEISFAFYMVHYPIANIITSRILDSFYISPVWHLTVYFIVALSLATMLYYSVERCGIKLGFYLCKKI